MQPLQWAIAAITAIFVAVVAFLQWRTAQQKAVLDLFEQRHAIYEIVREAVGTMASSSTMFDQAREVEFFQSVERAYFFFGDDVVSYLEQLSNDIAAVKMADVELQTAQGTARGQVAEKRRLALTRIGQFLDTGQPLFARYMRFSQAVPMNLSLLFDSILQRVKR